MTLTKFDRTLNIAQAYIESHEGTMPPMIVGFANDDEYIALLGTFRDFQEQLTFCSIARMGFILYGITEYYILTHGDLKYETDTAAKTVAKETAEVIMIAGVNSADRDGKIFRISRDHANRIERLTLEMQYDTSTIDGMFMNILPPKSVTLPDALKSDIEKVVAQIQYIAPETALKLEAPAATEVEESEPMNAGLEMLLQWQAESTAP